MTIWLDPQPVEVPEALQEVAGDLPLVGQTLVRRGIRSPEAARAFLDPAHYTQAPPSELPGIKAAVARLWQAIERKEQVAIWGDFDADGQTSTALLLETLRAIGADVAYRVPKRHEGHGIHLPALEKLIKDGTRLILTCDTGVTAHEAVALANQRGAEVIITDHHVLGDKLPPALAVINPHCLLPGHPMEHLVGVGVAYQLARALDPGAADRALDLVGLGTVADVGTLTGDNRYLVQIGLKALARTVRPGLRAVYESSGLRPEGITEEHIGFVLGPRLNALGRLADAARGVELLTTVDATMARALASEVEGLNAQRQRLTKQVTDGALAQIERDRSLVDDYNALVLSHPEWKGGIVGIVAGRLAQQFHKPVLLISAPAGDLARGSGRSIPGVDLVAALTACADPFLKTYGGHPAAAGFSLDSERIPEFRAAFSRAVAATAEAIPEPTLPIDAYVELPDLTEELVNEIGRLAPFGPGNPPLTLAVRDLRLSSQATIGRGSEHLRLTVQDPLDRTGTVFWWQGAGQPLPEGLFDLALSARATDYRGKVEIQLVWIDARPHEEVEVEIEPGPAFDKSDFRDLSTPEAEAILRGLIDAGEVQVWAEGQVPLPTGIKGRTRLELEPCRRLAVWTAPPGRSEWQQALDRAQPEDVLLFARVPGTRSGRDERETVLELLGGMVNLAVNRRQGEFHLERAAAKLGHRAGTVTAGLEHLAAIGEVAILERGERLWRVEAGGQPDPQQARRTAARLDDYLAETAAYRASFRTAPADTLA